MAARGIRGATTTEQDTPAAILDATAELLGSLIKENDLSLTEIAAAWFTTTRDLQTEFPAAAARRMGWDEVALMCSHEMEVVAVNRRAVPRCIRVLLLVNTERPARELRFIYLRGASGLRDAAP